MLLEASESIFDEEGRIKIGEFCPQRCISVVLGPWRLRAAISLLLTLAILFEKALMWNLVGSDISGCR